MRVHHLSVTAFGPFADLVEVDLDALSSGGLFLIHGPTGAGKTSLLDAICFALFANVPGARGRSKKALRSDHSPRDRTPTVTLEFTADEQRLRITRTPEYSRPKKRGSGEVSVPATVRLEVLRGSSWEVLSTRADEVGEKVNDVVGMGLAQFSKVAVLPQGDFAAFLRASAEDRRAVLEKLFDISTYADVEEWLADERRRTAAEAGALESAVALAVARLGDVAAQAGLTLDAADDLDVACDLDAAEDPDAADNDASDDDASAADPPLADEPTASEPAPLADRLAALLAAAEDAVIDYMAQADNAILADREASAQLARARTRVELRARGDRALAEITRLDAEESAHVGRRGSLEAAQRSAALAGHLLAGRRAAEAVEAADITAAAATGALERAGLEPDLAGAAALLASVQAHDESARDLEAARRRGTTLSTRLTALVPQVETAQAQVVAATTAHDDADARHASAQGDLTDAEALDHDVDAASARVDSCRTLVTLSAAVAADRARLASLEDERRLAHDEANAARTRQLDLRERYLGSIAAELAEDLTDDMPCLVCGSREHPDPARATDRVSRDEVEAADALAVVKSEVLQAAAVAVASLQAQVETRSQQLDGVDVDDLAAALARAEADLAAAHRQAAVITEARARLAAAASAVASARVTLDRAVAARQSLIVLRDDLQGEAADLAAEVRTLEDAHTTCPCAAGAPGRAPTAATLVDWSIRHHDAIAEVLARADRAAKDTDTARTNLAGARADLEAALAEHGFATVAEAEAPRLSPADLAALRTAIDAHDRARSTAAATLDEPDVAGALAAPLDDLTTLTSVADAARQHLLRITREQSQAESRRAELATAVPALLTDLDRLESAARTAATVRNLADVVAGLGPDNALKMRLTSYVLAARLESVVSFANERLTTLGSGRYLLEHTDEKSGAGRSGLGLRVLDQWTGQVRDPASLSGGETFMASLSLALGLADAVRADSGGYDLGTLFVDEGFGSLDDDSLEDVMAVLDGLQSGGRSVGVVSHVADLRTRIPRQLVVHKTPDGSSVSMQLGADVASPSAPTDSLAAS